jgi:hypothetical protein
MSLPVTACSIRTTKGCTIHRPGTVAHLISCTVDVWIKIPGRPSFSISAAKCLITSFQFCGLNVCLFHAVLISCFSQPTSRLVCRYSATVIFPSNTQLKGQMLSSSRPWKPRGGVELQLYSFVTSALVEDGWSASRPGSFTPGKDLVPIVQEAGWAPGWSGRVRKISLPPGFDPRTVQPMASRYTDWAIPTASIFNYPTT